MIVSFLKKPSYEPALNNSFRDSLKELFKALGYYFLFIIIGYLLLSGIDFFISFYTGFSFIETIDKLQRAVSKKDKSIFLILISGPILEEIMFRLPLKISRLNLFISISVFYFFFLLPKSNGIPIIKDHELHTLFFFLLILPSILFLLTDNVLNALSQRYFTHYFYFLAISFGVLHITNFISSVPNNLIYFAPIFTLSQIICGIFLGYLRIKEGILWGMFMHFCINLPIFIVYALSK